MPSLFCPAPVLRSLLRALFSDEYALYTATQSARRTLSGPDRILLDAQAQHLDSQLERLAWQLGCWGETAQVGTDAVRDSGAHLPHPSPVLHHLRLLHAGLVWQLHRFVARTSRLGDETLNHLLTDLLAGHTRAITALRQSPFAREISAANLELMPPSPVPAA